MTRIQDETEGVPIRTVKSFMTKIPSVVTGEEYKGERSESAEELELPADLNCRNALVHLKMFRDLSNFKTF